MQQNQHVLCLAGMHRSGTSMAAAWLQTAGLFMGRRLVGATYGNPAGHFEDRDFMELQRGWLRAGGVRFTMKSGQKLQLSEAAKLAGRSLIDDRTEWRQWGWKDPRSCLFLDFWKTEMPQMKVMAMFRRPQAVLDSINRRSLKQDASFPKSVVVPVWHSPENRPLMNRYLSTWIRYNEALLEFADRFEHDFLAVDVQNFRRTTSSLHNFLGNWGFDLNNVAEADYLREELLSIAPVSDATMSKYHLDEKLLKMAEGIYAALKRLSENAGLSL